MREPSAWGSARALPRLRPAPRRKKKDLASGQIQLGEGTVNQAFTGRRSLATIVPSGAYSLKYLRMPDSSDWAMRF